MSQRASLVVLCCAFPLGCGQRGGTVDEAMAGAFSSLSDPPVDIDPSSPLEGLQ